MTPAARASAIRKAWATVYEHTTQLLDEGYSVGGFMMRKVPGFGMKPAETRATFCSFAKLTGDIEISKVTKEKL